MKFTTLLLLVTIFNLFGSKTYSQYARLNLDMKDVPIQTVLSAIEGQSEFFFLYSSKMIDVSQKVNIHAENKNINEVLDNLLTSTDIKYSVKDRQILLVNKETDASLALQQNRVTGIVTEKNGTPIPGANVVVTGTTQGTMTDIAGKYSIEVPQGSKSLTFSFIGMESQEISIGTLTQINVTMAESAIGLEEVVVIGYGTQKKVNVIGSVTTVTNEEITAAPVAMISNALAGRMPGAIIQQSSGEPGNNASVILIRGKATLGDNSPLVVVDGIAGRDMNSLSPTDIESITVLKDASAAIYGARAANGVILITTKRGTAGTTATLNYGYYRGWVTPTKLVEMADAATYATMFREMQSYRNTPEGSMLYTLDDIEKYKSGKYPWTHPNTDWVDETLKDYSTTSNHNVSVSGGTQAVTYYGSFSSQFDDGIFTFNVTKYKRYNLKTNVDVKLNKYLSVEVDMTGSQEDRTAPVRSVWGVLTRSRPVSPALFPNTLLPGPGDVGADVNPVWVAGPEAGTNNYLTYRLNSKLSVNFIVPGVPGLTLSAYYAYDKYFSAQKLFEKPYTLYTLDKQAYLNAGNTGAEDGTAFLVPRYPSGPAEPRLTDTYNDSYNRVLNLTANYNKTIGGVHNVSAFIAMESSDYLAKGISAFRRYFISDELPYLFGGGTNDWTNSGTVALDARLNYFGRLMYNYKETYLFQFSLRRDGSLRFSTESGRWGTFPSVLAGWRISNENFWKNNVKFIDYLKLKASFGQMGNDQVSAFQYLTSYGFGTGMVLGKTYGEGLILSANPNPKITWEVANIINFGFESALLQNKLTINTDFFYQKRNKILVKRNASVPDYTGIGLPDENFGIVDNKGFELEIGYNDRKGDFLYGIDANMAFAINKIIEQDEPARSVPWQVLTGHPQGAQLLYKSIGIFRDQAQVDSLPHVTGARPGDIIILDYNDDKKITNDDRIIFDDTADPKFTYGVSFTLSYKNWNLRGLIQGVGPNLRKTLSELREGTAGNYYAWTAEGRWTPDNIDAKKPRAPESSQEYWRSTYQTDYNFQKGGYGRMKNIQLTYSIPQQLSQKLLMKDAQLYFSGENLFLIYNANKITDPENGSGISYPLMKTYSLGVKVTF